jgi:hypothetical protein
MEVRDGAVAHVTMSIKPSLKQSQTSPKHNAPTISETPDMGPPETDQN